MISYLKGRILNKKNNYIILLVSGIGYKIFINEKIYQDLREVKEEDDFGLYIFQRVKEDSLDLYGFKSLENLEFFELLISVSGIGPKSGLNILECFEVQEVKESILRGDSSLLSRVSGIGKKSAERIILELRNKVDGQMVENSQSLSDGGQELEALMSLGYSFQQAHQALKTIDQSLIDSSEKIRQALKIING